MRKEIGWRLEELRAALDAANFKLLSYKRCRCDLEIQVKDIYDYAGDADNGKYAEPEVL
jgi:hypothetical protein